MTAADRTTHAQPTAAAELRPAQALLQLLQDVRRQIVVTLPDGVPHMAAAQERLHAGLPALAGEPLVGGQSLAQHVARFLDALAMEEGTVGETARRLATALRARADVPWDDLAAVALTGEWHEIERLVPARDIDHRALATLLDWAVRPALAAAATRLADLVREARRASGRCPCCGALPGLAELRGTGDDRSRVLRCLRCGTAWTWPLLACPACNVRDHRHLGYVHVDGELEFRRAERCASCGFYVKAVATLAPLTVDELPATDLATTALDVMAGERGFWRAE